MSRRNIANYTTFNTLLVNSLEIQNSGTALSIYDNDPNDPVFSFNTTTRTFDITGLLNVSGEASFETITVSEYEAGMQSLASNNISDILDIGINGSYNDGANKYTGIIRDASDTFKRWTFFKDITAAPTTEIVGIDSTKLDSVRMNYLYVNNGSAAAPSLTFHNDTSTDTGLYLAAQNEIGFAAGGTKLAGLRYINGASSELELGATTNLKILQLDTIFNATSPSMPAITIGHIYMKSSSANDRWFKFYSDTAAGTPAYSGAVFTAAADNYFITNIGGSLAFARGTNVASPSSCPDYRDSATPLFLFNGDTSAETKLPFVIPLGSLGNLSIRFAGEATTGLYRSGVNTVGLVCAGAAVVNIAPTSVIFSQALYAVNGTLSTPAVSFSANTDVGLFRDTSLGRENITVTLDSIDAGKFSLNGSIPQLIMPLGGTAGAPSYSFADNDTGIYAPTNESTDGQLAISLGGVETVRFRRRTGTIAQGLGNIELYNSVTVTPDATKKTAAFYTNDTKIANTFKAYDSSFQSYNLIDESLLLLYTFRSAGSAGLDYSYNGIDATVVGAPTVKATEKDANSYVKRDALNFTGNSAATQYLNLTSKLTSFTTVDQATISFWFKISGALAGDNTIFDCYKTAGAKHINIAILSDANIYANALQVTVESDSLTTLQYHTATAGDSGTPSPVTIKDGLWHHVVIHLGSSGGSVTKRVIYIDNAELNTSNNKIYYTSTGDNVSQPELASNSFNDLSFNYVSIGAFYNGTAGSLGYTGYLKDIYITKRLLSPAEITTLYTEPTLYAYNIDAAKINVSDFSISSQCFFSDGSALFPAFTFTSDSDTGMYLATANTIGFSTNGAERLTVADTVMQYNGDFEVDSSKTWLKLTMASGINGPRVVFQHTSTPARHSIRTQHQGATIDGNYMDFYLYDTGALDADGLGNNQAMRLAVSAASPNSAIQTVYGIVRAHNGGVSTPTYSFTNSTGLGLYRVGADDLGVAAAGTLRLEVNTVVTVGNASGDATTRLYVPLGSQALPGYSFIGDTNTGIFSSAADNIDITCGNTLVTNFNSAGLFNQRPVVVDVTSTSAFVVRQDGAVAGGDILTVDTTNSRIGFGYASGLYLARSDAHDSTTFQRIKLSSSSAISNSLGLMILNETTAASSTDIAVFTMGKEQALNNSIDVNFNYVSSGSTSNKLGFKFNGAPEQLNIRADGTVNVVGTFTVSSAAIFTGQIQAAAGVVGAPSYTFTGDTTTGIYTPSAQQIAFATNGVIRRLITNTYEEIYSPLRLPNGSVGAPALTFSSDTSQNTGFYYQSNDRFAVSTGGQNAWIWDRRGTAPHECLNGIYFRPDGTNIRTLIEDGKLRASSNQTILNILPILHYKFVSAPAANTSTQDESINKHLIEPTTASYTTSTISLTDANGNGLLQYGAAQFSTAANDRIETATLVSSLVYLSNYKITLKFKTTSVASGGLFEIYGNRNGSTAANYIKATITSGDITLSIHNGTSLTLNASTTSTPLTTNIWYNLVLTLTSSGNSLTLDDTPLSLTYSTGSLATTITPTGFGDTSNLTVIVGGATASFLGYAADFYIAPTTTTETVTALYRTQAHEVYTNKLQLATTAQGLVDEGYILRSDKGNTAVWDNSLQIAPGYIQLNASKVLRVPDGTVSLPAVAFISDTNTGLYSGGSDILAFATGGVQRMSVSTAQLSLSSTVSAFIGNTTVPTSGASGALIVAGGIGLGNGSSTASRIHFGSGYTTTSQAANKLIALLDSAGNNYQFYGFGIQSGILAYNIAGAADAHVFYAGASSSTQSELLRVTGGGAVRAQDGSVGAPAYSFANSVTTGLYRIGPDNIGIAAAGTKVMDISGAVTQVANDFQAAAGFRKSFTVVSSISFTPDTTHCIVELSYSATASDVVVTLPEAVDLNKGREYTLIKTGNGGGRLVINTFDSNDYIDDNSTLQIILAAQFDRVTLVCNGVNRWYTI